MRREVERVFDVAWSCGKLAAVGEAVGRFLDGKQDPDLMTRKQLTDAAILFAKMAGELAEKSHKVPIEDYVLAEMSPRDREWYRRCQEDTDIDLDLDGDDE